MLNHVELSFFFFFLGGGETILLHLSQNAAISFNDFPGGTMTMLQRDSNKVNYVRYMPISDVLRKRTSRRLSEYVWQRLKPP